MKENRNLDTIFILAWVIIFACLIIIAFTSCTKQETTPTRTIQAIGTGQFAIGFRSSSWEPGYWEKTTVSDYFTQTVEGDTVYLGGYANEYPILLIIESDTLRVGSGGFGNMQKPEKFNLIIKP